MHHSDEADRRSLAVTCYLDESGTDDLAPTAVVAGVVLNKRRFFSLDRLWGEMLARHGVEPPLHMREFGRKGRLRHIGKNERRALFSAAADLINSHKVYTVAATLTQAQFKTLLTPDIRKTMGAYGMCFILCVYLNHLVAQQKQYRPNIAYVLDTGNNCKHQVIEAHGAMKEWQHSKPLHVGALAFEDDKQVGALQAADVTAWGVRRKMIGSSFKSGFEPIKEILDEHDHIQEEWTKKVLTHLSDSLIDVVGSARASPASAT